MTKDTTRPAQTREVNTTYKGRPVTVSPEALKPRERIAVPDSKVDTSNKAKPSRRIAYPLA